MSFGIAGCMPSFFFRDARLDETKSASMQVSALQGWIPAFYERVKCYASCMTQKISFTKHEYLTN
jgi:hypothetical protein